MTKPQAVNGWNLLDPHDNDSDNNKIRDVLWKLIRAHKKVHYYRKLSIKHLRKFMKDQPHAPPGQPNPSGKSSWRASLYQHANLNLNTIFFMRRTLTANNSPRFCMTICGTGAAPGAPPAAGAMSPGLAALNELAWNFQYYNVDPSTGQPFPLEILSTFNETIDGYDNCPTDDTDALALYKEGADNHLINYDSEVNPDDPSYNVDPGETLYRWVLTPVHP